MGTTPNQLQIKRDGIGHLLTNQLLGVGMTPPEWADLTTSEGEVAVTQGAARSVDAQARITYRKTRRAERVPGFEQAPDFIVPDELVPLVVIEAKITNDDGTARDKVARLLRLAQLSDERVARGDRGFQVVTCIDGRGFGIRREDMRLLLRRMHGKVFTLKTLDQLIPHTR